MVAVSFISVATASFFTFSGSSPNSGCRRLVRVGLAWRLEDGRRLLEGCCELSDDQYRMLRGKYLNMTLRNLSQTRPPEYLPDCVVLTNSTQQLAPQRCCNERRLLSLTMPSDAFKEVAAHGAFYRSTNGLFKCGHVACKDISNRLEIVFYAFVLFCVTHLLAYWTVKAEYKLLRLMAETRRTRELTTTQETRGVPRSQATPAVGH
ncbi:hypothetical protein MTO96_032760 [Rhipicephalus appendiculatus]